MKKPISSRLQISLIMMIFIIPLVLFLIIYNLYTINFYNRRIAQTGRPSRCIKILWKRICVTRQRRCSIS